MDIVLYKNFSVENTLNKNITEVARYTGQQLVEPYDDYDISVRFNVSNSTLKWSNVNYMMVDGAYYFIESVEHQVENIATVHGRMDLLMTYADAIKKLKVVAERSTSHGNIDIEDGMRLYEAGCERAVMEFPSVIQDSESSGCYILTTSQTGYLG